MCPLPPVSSTTASRTNSEGVATTVCLLTMPYRPLARVVVALAGVLTPSVNDPKPFTTGQSRRSTRTTLVVSPTEIGRASRRKEYRSRETPQPPKKQFDVAELTDTGRSPHADRPPNRSPSPRPAHATRA